MNLANGTERNHEPDRARQRGGARGDARRGARAARRARAAAEPDADAAARATVVEAGEPGGADAATLEVDGRRRARARRVADVALVGRVAAGRRGRSSTSRRVDLGLGSGGFDIVHVNLTRGLDGEGTPGAHVMKLNYTSLQHAVLPVEERRELRGRRWRARSAVFGLHGQLAPLAWALGAGARRARGSATCRPRAARCPARSRDTVARAARARPARRPHHGRPGLRRRAGGDHDRGRDPRRPARRWAGTPRSCGPGPGILGSARRSATAAWPRSTRRTPRWRSAARRSSSPRMSSGDPRERHRGLSHHTRHRARAAAARCRSPCARLSGERRPRAGASSRHEWRRGDADLDGYARVSGLPDAHDGPHARRGPRLLRRRAGRRRALLATDARA